MEDRMALLDIIPLKPSVAIVCTVLALLVWTIRSYTSLRHVDGPFLASLTNWVRYSWVLTNRAHEIHLEEHRKHGKLVRFGPNMVSVADPSEIPNIYGFSAKYQKVQ